MDLNPSRILQKAPLELVMSLEVLRYTHRVRMFHDVSFRHIKIYKEVLSIQKKCILSTNPKNERTGLNSPDPKWSPNMHQLAPFWNPSIPPKAADSRRRVAPAKSPHLPFREVRKYVGEKLDLSVLFLEKMKNRKKNIWGLKKIDTLYNCCV